MSYTIPSGSILIFNDTITTLRNTINIEFVSNNTLFNAIINNYTYGYEYIVYRKTDNGIIAAYNYNYHTYTDNDYKTIELTSDFVTDDEYIIQWFKTNVSSGLPAEPMEEAYQATGNLITNTFTSIGQLTDFVSNNNAVWICTAGIIIVSFVVGLLHRIRKRTFKSR